MCLYGFTFELSHPLFVGRVSVCLYGFTSALSHPLFVRRMFVCACMVSHPHYPLPRTMSSAPLSKVRCCRPKKFVRLPEGLLYTHQPLHPHNPLKPPSSLFKTHPHPPFSPRVSPQLLLRFPHRQPRRRPTHNRICSSARRFAPLCLASPAFQLF